MSARHFGGGPKQRLTSLSPFHGHKLDICQLPDRWPSKPTAHLDNRSATQRRAERFVGKRQRLIGRKSPAFCPNITLSKFRTNRHLNYSQSSILGTSLMIHLINLFS